MIRTLLFTAVLAWAGGATADEFGEWSRFVPPSGRTLAEVMVLDAPEDINEISLRVQQAAQANPDWFRQYAAAAEPGKPLRWHENMGISEDEYARLLSGANELVLTRAGEVEIVFSAADGVVTLRGLPMAPPNDKLVYVPAKNAVLTGFGELADYSVIDQDDPTLPEGRWEGLRWKLERKGPGTDHVSVKLSIGQLKEQTLRMIYLDVNATRDGVADQFHYLLLYEGGN